MTTSFIRSVLLHGEQTARRLALTLFAAIVLLYCGLIGLGQWQADEYADFSQLEYGVRAVANRLRWSPRPLSEPIFLGYGWLTIRFQRPLTPLFLGLLWACLAGAALSTLWLRRQSDYDRDETWLDALSGVSLMAAFLTAGPLTQVFYWPAGAVAYLPTLSGTLFLFLQVASGSLDTSIGRMRCGIALMIAALSSETGAVFVASFALVMAMYAIAKRLGRDFGSWDLRPQSWCVLPALVSAGVLLAMLFNRFRAAEPVSQRASATLGHPAASAMAATVDLVADIFGLGPHVHGWFLFNPQFFSVALLAFGIGLCWNQTHAIPERTRSDLGCLASGLLLGSIFTLAACYIHFGQAVEERHRLIILCWIRLALASIAVAVLGSNRARHLREHRVLRVLGPVLIVCGVVIVWHLKPLVREYRAYGAVRKTTKDNFRSGFAPGSSQIVWGIPANRGVITPATIEAGTYHRTSPSDFPSYILMYFKKDTLVVRSPAEQWGQVSP